MTMQIRSIILYNRAGATREVSFRPGAVNIITGRSLTGKSAIIDIVDYCMGRSTFNIPEGVIRDSVAWYAVVFKFGDNTEVLVAKPAPKENAASMSQAYYEVGAPITTPPLSKLIPNSNDDAVIKDLSKRVGILPNLHMPPAGQSRNELEATIRHTIFYLFQTQGLIASKELLFHRQLEQLMPQTIKDTLPYFLGVVNSERVRLEHELRLAKRRLKLASRDLDEAQFVATDQLTRGQSLITEAQQVGILRSAVAAGTAEEIVETLRSVLTWAPSTAPLVEEDRLAELRQQADTRRGEFKAFQRQIDAAEVFQRDAQAYASEAGEQVMRLQSIRLFNAADGPHRCPVCSSDIPVEVPTVSAVAESLRRLGADLQQVDGERPRLREYIDSLKTERETARQRLAEAEFALEAAQSEQEAAEEFRNANARAARVVGRVSLYVETVKLVNEQETLQAAVRKAETEVDRLESLLAEDGEQDLLASILNRMGQRMTAWSEMLQLEHRAPYRLDLNNLTVVADRPGRPIPMQRMGGGKNALGCHLLALLALHEHFVQNNCPVPGFLVLDQPTQVYFPSTQQYKALSGTTKETLESDADLAEVGRMFDLLFSVCAELVPNFQIIVLEHANLPDERYQDALVEEPWSGVGTHALVPEEWK
jgi:Protein of unknown function (DUF3732)